MRSWKQLEIETPDGSRSPVVLHSDDEGRVVAQGQRLEVRVRDVVPEGQDLAHVLHVRTVALPVRRPDAGGDDPGQRSDLTRIPVARAEHAGGHTDPGRHADTAADRRADAGRDAGSDPGANPGRVTPAREEPGLRV